MSRYGLLNKLKTSAMNLFEDSNSTNLDETKLNRDDIAIEKLKVKAISDAKKESAIPVKYIDLRNTTTQSIYPLSDKSLYVLNKSTNTLNAYGSIKITVDKYNRVTDSINGYKNIDIDEYLSMIVKYNKTYVIYSSPAN